ncbi:MAG: formylglycine-generating enzyme family protein, partial [bacterium]
KKRKLKEGDTYLVPMGVSGKLELQYIPGGTFNMGAYSRADDQHPVHKVSLSPFWIGRYEITQAQWRAVTGGNVSYFYNEQHSHTHYQGGTLPAEQVSWASLEKFFQRLNRITGKKFRLPTEAEWEYAARAGSPGDYFGGGGVSLLPDFAWFKDNSELGTHLIGGKKPNAWGVYDMTGNVAEWCQDWYSPDFYASAARKDPVNTGKPEKNPRKVVRGGSWFNEKDILYLSYRNKISVKRTKPPVGFRVALPVTGKTGEK